MNLRYIQKYRHDGRYLTVNLFISTNKLVCISAIDNLQNVKNNTDASLSSIQDTDYATTMQLAKEKVLSSASQAMLGQSNQMQSQVVQLSKQNSLVFKLKLMNNLSDEIKHHE